MVDVKNRWALITGASRGIGYLTAKFMASMGCNLVLHSRTMEHSERVAAEVREMGVKAYAVCAELSDLDAVKKTAHDVDYFCRHGNDRLFDKGLKGRCRRGKPSQPSAHRRKVPMGQHSRIVSQDVGLIHLGHIGTADEFRKTVGVFCKLGGKQLDGAVFDELARQLVFKLLRLVVFWQQRHGFYIDKP